MSAFASSTLQLFSTIHLETFAVLGAKKTGDLLACFITQPSKAKVAINGISSFLIRVFAKTTVFAQFALARDARYHDDRIRLQTKSFRKARKRFLARLAKWSRYRPYPKRVRPK